MKKKGLFTAIIAALVAFTCAFAIACGPDKDPSGSGGGSKPQNPAPVALTVSLDETSGAVSFSPAAEGAKNYEITVLRYQEEPKKYTAAASPYVVAPIEAGEIRITVRALGEDDKELGAGSVAVTLTRNIGMPQSVEGVTVSGDTLRWTAEESAVSYTVEAVKNGAVVKTESGVTATELDLTSLALGAGKYEMRVSGVNSANVKGTAGSDYYLVKGDSGFLTETATGSGEYYLADFRKPDAREFTENHGATVKPESGTLEYTDAEWDGKGVWYTLPEAIDWNTVLQIKMRIRVTGTTSGGCYAYLFNEKNVNQGVYPGQSWQGFGTESLTDDGDGWQITTFSAELIRRQTMNDSYWTDGEAEYLARIFFGSSAPNANIEVDYVTYTKRTAANEFTLTYNGAELADSYRSVDKFDWSRIGIAGENSSDYTVDYRLERDGARVEFENEQRLEAGEYKLIAKARGEYYGKAVKEFTVISSDLPIPGDVSGLKYEGTSLSWTAAENAASYRIVAKNIGGKVITETVSDSPAATLALPGGKINVIVTAVSADNVEGRDVLTQVVSLGETHYMSPAASGSDQLVVADFDSDDYLGFMSAGSIGSFDVAEGNLVFSANESFRTVATYDLPSAINANEVYKFIVRVNASGVVDNKTGANLVFYNQLGETATAYLWATAYYGTTKTLDGDWWNVEFSFRSLATCDAAPESWGTYKWTTEDNVVDRIAFEYYDAREGVVEQLEQVIDYIRVIKMENVAKEDISIKYNGGAVAAEYTTATDFDWTKFTVEGYEATFALTSGGAAVEKTTRLAEGDYTLTATLTGKYVGSKSIDFHVKSVVIPDAVADLAFDKTTKTVTFTKAEGAETYAFYVTTAAGATTELAHGAIVVEGETVSAVITSDLPAGNVTVVVRSVSVDGVKSEPTGVSVLVLGNTNFGAPKTEGSMYTYIANFNHADYAAFATAGDNVTSITGTESGLIVEGVKSEKITNEKGEVTGINRKYNSFTIDIPVDIDVENKDFIIKFTFAPILDDVTSISVNLYNEEGKTSYSYFDIGNIWNSAYTEGGVMNVSASTIGEYDYNNCQVVLSLSAAKIAASDNSQQWTNKKAKKITKIAISYATMNGKLPIKDVIVYEDMTSKFTSGSAVTVGEAQGVVAFDVKDDANVAYNEYSIQGGVLSYSNGSDWSTFTTYTLPEAVTLPAGSIVRGRIKGSPNLTISDSGNSKVRVNWIDTWGNELPSYVSVKEDGDSGWYIFSFDSSNLAAGNIAKIHLGVSYKDKSCYVDYIMVIQPVQVPAENISIKYNGGEVAGEYTTATDFDWTKFTVEGYGATFALTSGGAAVEKTTRLAEGDYTLTATLTGDYVGSKSINFHVREIVTPDEATGLAFDGTSKKLSWKKANGADTYEVTAKTKAGAAIDITHGGIVVEGDMVSVTITSDLPVGYLTFAVQPVSADGVKATATELNAAVLGNTNFGAPKAEGSMYTYIANFNHADYAAFATAGDNVTSITGTESGLIVEGKENEWNSVTVDIPVDIDVENKDFIIKFTFAPILDDANSISVNLYNEEGKTSYSYFDIGNIWKSAYTEGGVMNVSASTIGEYDYNNCQVVLSLSAAKIAASDNSQQWTNKKAKKITKIALSYKTVNGKLPIKDIIVYEDMTSKFTSGSAVTVGEAQGTTVFDVKDDANVAYNEYSIQGGVLGYSMPNDWATFTTYTLPEAVAIGESSVIKLRVKGRTYITLKDSNGNNVCNQIKWHDGWFDGGVSATTEKDGEYTIITVAADKITNKNAIKSISLQGAEANQAGYIDYIAVVG